MVLEAIKKHSGGFDTDNIMALTLMLCDKLDIKYSRVAKAGYNVLGIRQFQYIKDIVISIENSVLKINFICNDKMDVVELENYYFTAKAFKSIKAFCKKMNFEPLVLINDNIWIAFNR